MNFDPNPGLYSQVWKKKFKNIFEKKFSRKKVYVLTLTTTKCHLNKFSLSCVSELWIYILNLTHFYLLLFYIQYIYRKLLNTDPIWILIHNTGINCDINHNCGLLHIKVLFDRFVDNLTKLATKWVTKILYITGLFGACGVSPINRSEF